jgi:hypothetical protein
MFRALRSAVGLPAALLTVFLTLGTALPAALHGETGDDACDVVEGNRSEGSRLEAAGHASSTQHCGICHWLRSLRVFQSDAAEPQPAVASSSSVCGPALRGSGRLLVEPVPARAPPA